MLSEVEYFFFMVFFCVLKKNAKHRGLWLYFLRKIYVPKLHFKKEKKIISISTYFYLDLRTLEIK